MDKPWVDVQWLMAETEKLYARMVALGGRDKLTATRDIAVRERGWQPTLPQIQAQFPDVLRALGFFYVPKQMQPGPMFVFPIRNLQNSYERAQTRPLPGSAEYEWAARCGAKYLWSGTKMKEPSWLGNDPETLQRIIDCRWCVLVEGPFDLLACRLLAPKVPTLCTLTKNVGTMHEDYLRILGVKSLYLLFDNEKPKDGQHGLGQGNLAMRRLRRKIKTMHVETMLCPASDPSEALRSVIKAKALREMLRSL